MKKFLILAGLAMAGLSFAHVVPAAAKTICVETPSGFKFCYEKGKGGGGGGGGYKPKERFSKAHVQYDSRCKYRSAPGYGKGFWDPRKGGECWACPKGTRRTIKSVAGPKACRVGAFGVQQRARFLGKNGCKGNTFAFGTKCWVCPKRYRRNGVNNDPRNARACRGFF